MKRTLRPRTSSDLSDPIRKRLEMYALAAGAAGVGVLATSQPAEGRIIYTPAHQNIPTYGKFDLDVNHDGSTDFQFYYGAYGHSLWLTVHGSNQRNEVWGKGRFVSALPAGVCVGANKRKFQPTHSLMEVFGVLSSTFSTGYWNNVRRRYVGLKFVIKGRVHFGWARMNVTINNHEGNVTLTGYAYETIPHKAIVTGRTKGPNAPNTGEADTSHSVRTPERATLGRLAMGASRGRTQNPNQLRQ